MQWSNTKSAVSRCGTFSPFLSMVILFSVEQVNLACSIICFRLDGNISSPVRYLKLSILLDYKADILAASLLISYCNFSSLVWSSIIMISLYIKKIVSKS